MNSTTETAIGTAATAKRDQLVLEHLSLAKAIAVRLHQKLPTYVDLDDLVHAGVLGLFEAATRFASDKNVGFACYATHRIRGAILDSLRRLDWASREMRRRHKRAEAATRELATELHRAPTEEEVAGKLGIELDQWRRTQLDLFNIDMISGSTRSSNHEDLPEPEFPCKPEAHPDNICAVEQMRSALGTAMKALPRRYQKVISLYYTDQLTMKEIGGVLGVNESRVSQIHKLAIARMQIALQASGISSSRAF